MSTSTAPVRPITTRTRQLATYGVVVGALAIAANLSARAMGADAHHISSAPVGAQLALYAQAVIPAVAALVAWRTTTSSWGRAEWGFRRTARGPLVTAWGIGVLAVVLGYAAAWLIGVAGVSGVVLTQRTGMPAAVAIGVALLPGVVPWLALAVGEELGWSSFLVPRLRERLSPNATALVLGLAWSAFHVPLMLLVPGAVAPGVPTAYAVAMFTVECVALAFPLAWLRLRTGSIWPPLVLHATLNSVLYLALDPATTMRAHSDWFVREGGLLVALGCVAAVVLTAPLWRRLPR